MMSDRTIAEQVRQALEYAYIDTESRKDTDYRAVSETEIEQLMKGFTSSCDVNASNLIDTNYSTSYKITITDHDAPAWDHVHRVLEKSLRPALPFYALTVRVSWLGRFAMMFWNRFRKRGYPEMLWLADTRRNRQIEACVRGLIEGSRIQLLSREELSEEYPIPGLVLLDNAPHTVAHLLFAQYL